MQKRGRPLVEKAHPAEERAVTINGTSACPGFTNLSLVGPRLPQDPGCIWDLSRGLHSYKLAPAHGAHDADSVCQFSQKILC